MAWPDISALLVALHWIGMLLGLGTAALADFLGIRLLLSRRAGRQRRLFPLLHVTIGIAILLLVFSGAGLMVLRAERWCELPGNTWRIGSFCLPYKLAVKLTLLHALVAAAMLIDAYVMPLGARRERPLLAHLELHDILRVAPIGAASLTCWTSMAAIPFFKALHSVPPLELLAYILSGWLAVTIAIATILLLVRLWLRRDLPLVVADAGAGARIISFKRAPLSGHAHARSRLAHAHGRPLDVVPAADAAPVSLRDALAANGRTITGALAISFVINALMLTGPIYMLQVYDRVLTSRSVETLAVLTMLVIGLFCVMALLDHIRARVLARIAVRFDTRIAPSLLTSALNVPASGAPSNPQSPLRDLELIRQLMAGPTPAALFDLPWAPVYFAIVFLLHPLLGLLAVAGAVLLVALSILNQVLTQRQLAKSAESTARCDAMLDAARRNAEAVHALGMGASFRQRWLDEHARALAVGLKVSDVASRISAVSRSSRMLLQSMLLGAGAWLALHDAVSAGAMVASSIIAARALAPVDQVIANWRGIGLARSAWQRCRDRLARAPQATAALARSPQARELDIANLYVAPPGEREPVLKNVTFRLAPGDALAVIGPSGAGKSTLARALVGVWPIRHGNIRLDGVPLDLWRSDTLGRHLGYLPQDVSLFDGTVAENIARFDAAADPASIYEAAAAAGVHDTVHRLRHGYDTRIGDAGCVLPGGQRQRIALARALYGAPGLVVLDEPNASLDAEGEDALKAAILRLRAARCIVIVMAHRQSVLAVANRLLVLRDGRQVAYGAPAAVVRALNQKEGARLDNGKVAAFSGRPRPV